MIIVYAYNFENSCKIYIFLTKGCQCEIYENCTVNFYKWGKMINDFNTLRSFHSFFQVNTVWNVIIRHIKI